MSMFLYLEIWEIYLEDQKLVLKGNGLKSEFDIAKISEVLRQFEEGKELAYLTDTSLRIWKIPIDLKGKFERLLDQ
jgi:hypothetical protein